MDKGQNPIKFRFDKQKFVTVMQILAIETEDLDVLKAVKLLYFIDREHLRRYGRPVLGDYYVAMKLGPVPSRAYDELKKIPLGNAPELPLSATTSGRQYPVFTSIEDPNFDYLSPAELEVVRQVICELGHKSGLQLKDIAHKHATWATADLSEQTLQVPIPYEKFFEEDFEACKYAYDAMLLEQEERDFAGGL